MKKSLSYISFVAAVALFSGCGSSSTTPPEGGGADTTAPVFSTSAAYNFTLDEGTNRTVTIAVTDNVTAVADIVLSSDDVTIMGSSFTYTAPTVTADTNFTVTVTAEDEAGLTKAQVYTFTVTNVPAQPDVRVAPVGDKEFTVLSNNILRGPVPASNLDWRNEHHDGNLTEAQGYCVGLGNNYRLPTRSELYNLIDYGKSSEQNASLLDDAITTFANVSTLWSSENNTFINTVTGQVSPPENNASALHAIICVQGSGEIDHNITASGNIVTDNSTLYEWTKIDVAPANAMTYSEAETACPVGFNLPNINELRSIYDYDNRTLEEVLPDAASNAVRIWSSTAYLKGTDRHYVILNKQVISTTISDDTNEHYVTCVKKPTP